MGDCKAVLTPSAFTLEDYRESWNDLGRKKKKSVCQRRDE